MQPIMLIVPQLQMICRECKIEIDDRSDHTEHELMTQNNKFHNKLIVRCMKCMQKQYNGYHFKNVCKVNRTGVISSVHSYIDYTDINNSDNDDNIDNNKDEDYLKKVLNELKVNSIKDIKFYIKDDFITEILNEIRK